MSHTYLAFAFRKEGGGAKGGAPERGRGRARHVPCNESDIVMMASADGGAGVHAGAQARGAEDFARASPGEGPAAKRRRERSPGRDEGETRSAVVYDAGARADSLLD